MTDSNGPGVEILHSQLKTYLEIYRHHFDLYLKAIALYLGVVGATATYIFQEGVNGQTRVALSVFITVVSLGSVAGGYVSRGWVMEIEKRAHSLSAELSLDQFPFSGAKGVIHVMVTLSGVVAVVAFLNVVTLIFSGP